MQKVAPIQTCVASGAALLDRIGSADTARVPMRSPAVDASRSSPTAKELTNNTGRRQRLVRETGSTGFGGSAKQIPG